MAAYWNLQCIQCNAAFANVGCSMYDIPACPDCGGERRLAPSASIKRSTVFPFTVNHVDGKPMEIRDLQHLRHVEKTYGVAFSVFSKDNINDMDNLRSVDKYRGEDAPFHVMRERARVR